MKTVQAMKRKRSISSTLSGINSGETSIVSARSDSSRASMVTVASTNPSYGSASSEYVAKPFKAGNSQALRIPSALKLKKNTDYIITTTPQGFILTDPKALTKRREALAALWGSAPEFPNVDL